MTLTLIPKQAIHSPAGHGGGAGRPCTCKTAPAARCMACNFFGRVWRDVASRRAAACRRPR